MIRNQQDTTKTNTLLQQVPDNIGQKKLKVVRPNAILKPIPERETQNVVSDKVIQKPAKPQPPSAAQLKNRWWQREQKLLVGDSRYIEPQNEIKLKTISYTEQKGIALPNREISRPNNDWLTVLLIAALVLFATVRHSYSKYLIALFQSIFNYSTSSRMYEEKNYSFLHAAFRLEVYFYLIFAVFIYQLFNYFNVALPYNNFGLFLFSLGLVLTYFIGKKLIYNITGVMVEGISETKEFLFNLDNVNRVTGLVLFPVVLLIAFFPLQNLTTPVILGVAAVIFLYFLLLFRGFTILLRKQFSIYYLFLYFCTLEFLPLVLLYKIVVL